MRVCRYGAPPILRSRPRRPFEDVGDGVLAQQHAAQDRLLGGQILRRLAAEVLSLRGCVGRLFKIVDNRHRAGPTS